MAIIKETLPFTFDENYQKIAQKFIEKGFDAPYEGSNTAVLASVLSYIVSSLNFSTAYISLLLKIKLIYLFEL